MEGTKVSLAFLIIGSTAVSVLIIASLAIGEWTNYCFWHFGLVAVSEINGDMDTSDATDLASLYNDICNDRSNQILVETFCPGFCGNIENFALGGVLMLLIGIGSLLSQVVVSLLAALKVIKTNFNLKISYIFLFICTGAYIVGFLIYFIIINPNSIKDTRSTADNWAAKIGIILAAVTCFVIIGFNVLAYISVHKVQRVTDALIRY